MAVGTVKNGLKEQIFVKKSMQKHKHHHGR